MEMGWMRSWGPLLKGLPWLVHVSNRVREKEGRRGESFAESGGG